MRFVIGMYLIHLWGELITQLYCLDWEQQGKRPGPEVREADIAAGPLATQESERLEEELQPPAAPHPQGESADQGQSHWAAAVPEFPYRPFQGRKTTMLHHFGFPRLQWGTGLC